MSNIDNLASWKAKCDEANAERLEDLLWLTETGECMVGAAERLGLSVDTLERWCTRRNLHDLLAKLKSRDPFDPAMTMAIRGKLGADARWSA